MSIKSKTIRHKALPVTVQNLRTHTTHTHSLCFSLSFHYIKYLFKQFSFISQASGNIIKTQGYLYINSS